MSPAQPTMADRRRRLVRAELGRVAIALFADRGFEAVTVDDIAQAAGMSQRTFFRYFASKDEVVLDYERHLIERLVAAFDERPADEGPVTALREAFIATSHVEHDDRGEVLRRAQILDAAPSLRARADGASVARYDVLTEHVARRMGVPASDTRARTVVAAMTAVTNAEFRAWTREGGRGDPAARIGAALRHLEDGLTGLDRGISRRSRASRPGR